MGKSLTNEEKQNFLTHTWNPNATYIFASQIEGKQMRKFQIDWMNQFKWLAYSEIKTGAFCKICVLFAPSQAGIGSHQVIQFLKHFELIINVIFLYLRN